MKLLKQLDIGEYDTSGNPADNMQPDNHLQSVISNVNGVPENQIISPKDFNNYVPQDWSPQQQAAYQELNKPTTGKLNPEDYYPTLHHNIAVGNYSGSEIGSTTLFAPAGRIVPLGMRDARDAAVQRQVLQKMKEQDEFNKKFQSPTTKHVPVQQELSKQYQQGLSQWVGNAKQKYGQNWVQGLEQDPNFNAWNKSHQDFAKYHDQIANHMAELDMAEKDPNFVLSPELRKRNAEFKSGMYTLGTGGAFTQKARDLEADFLASKGQYDLDKATNEVIDKVKPAVEEADINNLKYKVRGKQELVDQYKKSYYPDEKIDQMADLVYGQKYIGTDVTKDMVKQAIKAKLNDKVEHQLSNYTKFFEPKENKDDYSRITPQVETTFNATVNTGQYDKSNNPITEVRPVYAEQAHNTLANDQQKKLNFVQSSAMKDLSGSGLEKTSGNFEGNVQKVAVFPYNISEKRFYTPEEVANMKKNGIYTNNHNVKFETGVIVNTSPKKDANGDIIGGSATSIVVPTDDVKGKLSEGFDKKILENEQKANELNGLKKVSKPSSEQTTYKIKGKEYGHSAVKKAADASGMTIDEYLTELNKK